MPIFPTCFIGTIEPYAESCMPSKIAGLARPVLKALHAGGRDGVFAFLDGVEAELRATMLLTGSGTLDALRRAPRVITGELLQWVEQLR